MVQRRLPKLNEFELVVLSIFMGEIARPLYFTNNETNFTTSHIFEYIDSLRSPKSLTSIAFPDTDLIRFLAIGLRFLQSPRLDCLTWILKRLRLGDLEKTNEGCGNVTAEAHLSGSMTPPSQLAM
jgi:hypothetical protein